MNLIGGVVLWSLVSSRSPATVHGDNDLKKTSSAGQCVTFKEVVRVRMSCFCTCVGLLDRVPSSGWIDLEQLPCYMCTDMKFNQCVLQDIPGNHNENKVWKWWDNCSICFVSFSAEETCLRGETLTGTSGQCMGYSPPDGHLYYSDWVRIWNRCEILPL